MTRDPPQLTSLNREIDRRKNGANGRYSNMNSCPYIAGTTNDLNRFLRPNIHNTNTEFVGIGMFVTLQNMAHYDALGQATQIIDLLDLKASHGEAFAELIRGFSYLDEILQPGKGDPHVNDSIEWRSYEAPSHHQNSF